MAVTSSEKLIKAACKPKKGAPKAKYLDPIIASTQVPDGPISDLCAALAPRLREPQVDTVFKALLVLHSMIRSGGTDNVLEYLSRMDVLRLKSVGTGGFWEGYSQTETLTHYAHYLHARITAYRELKHDMVRVQAENNRASAYRTHSEGASERARKLRSLTVEKGLLRETRQVQKIIDALVKAEWYKDDLQDECTVLAFRMMVKDLLVLFQAGNEGIINLLEHYFEMEHKQAADALTLYKSFCTQTKKVVEYLKYAKELNNIIDVPIPNLKHAPVSLVTALQEYLDDPNFEENRSEYKQNKDVADGKAPAPKKAVEASKPAAAASSSTSAPAPSTPAQSKQPQALVDFFSSIEENQPTMFNPQTNSPTSAYFEQQATFNPFAARLQQQQTGLPPQQPQFFGQQPSPFGQQQMPMQLQPQATGFAAFGGGFPPPQQPQFGLPPQQQQQQQQLQPQATGFNPFRQSMLMPQSTGFPQQHQQPQQQQQQPPMPSIPSNGFLNQNAFAQQQQQQSPPAQQQQQPSSSPFDFLSQPPPQQQPSSNGFLSAQPTGFGQQPLQPQPTGHHPTNPFGQVRSATSPPSMQPLVAQPTGSKNPFAPAGGIVPPMPTRHSDLVGGKGPSLHELAFGGGGAFGGTQQQQQQQQQQPQQQQSNGAGGLVTLDHSYSWDRSSLEEVTTNLLATILHLRNLDILRAGQLVLPPDVVQVILDHPRLSILDNPPFVSGLGLAEGPDALIIPSSSSSLMKKPPLRVPIICTGSQDDSTNFLSSQYPVEVTNAVFLSNRFEFETLLLLDRLVLPPSRPWTPIPSLREICITPAAASSENLGAWIHGILEAQPMMEKMSIEFGKHGNQLGDKERMRRLGKVRWFEHLAFLHREPIAGWSSWRDLALGATKDGITEASFSWTNSRGIAPFLRNAGVNLPALTSLELVHGLEFPAWNDILRALSHFPSLTSLRLRGFLLPWTINSRILYCSPSCSAIVKRVHPKIWNETEAEGGALAAWEHHLLPGNLARIRSLANVLPDGCEVLWNPTLTGNKRAERQGEAPFGTWRWTVLGKEGQEEAKLVEKEREEDDGVILPRSLKMMESFCWVCHDKDSCDLPEWEEVFRETLEKRNMKILDDWDLSCESVCRGEAVEWDERGAGDDWGSPKPELSEPADE